MKAFIIKALNRATDAQIRAIFFFVINYLPISCSHEMVEMQRDLSGEE